MEGWFGETWTLSITYDHGYATIPVLVKATAVEMVARVWVNPMAASSSAVGGATFAFPAQGLALTPAEIAALKDFSGRVRFHNVQLR
jgi:hypothetical protein